MIRCDMFALEVTVERAAHSLLEIRLTTDLPAGALVIVDCARTYETLRERQALWTVFNERFEVKPRVRGDFNGFTVSVDVDAGDEQASSEFEESLSDFSAGIRAPVSDSVTVTATLGGRQRLRPFGRNNENLSGSEVTTDGGIKIARAVVEVSVPMRAELQPLAEDV